MDSSPIIEDVNSSFNILPTIGQIKMDQALLNDYIRAFRMRIY